MKPIGEVRQLRLIQLLKQTGLSYAAINERLGRSRRDASLSQIVNAAPNTSSGKPRRMGDRQARTLELVFDLPVGWFDSDPDSRPAAIERLSGGVVWPFESVQPAEIAALSAERKRVLERVMLAYIGAS